MVKAKSAKPLKNVDSVSRALMLNNFCRVFALLGAAGLLLGGLSGLLIAFIVSAGVAISAVGLSGLVSDIAVNVFFGMRNGRWSLREGLAGDLSCVRVHKMNARFDDALVQVESILARDPDHPEALLLKAQILWEGYGDGPGARKYLINAVKTEPDRSAPIHRWASALYSKLRSEESRQACKRPKGINA